MSGRNIISYPFQERELQTIKQKMLNWLRPFSIFCCLDNNSYRHEPNRFEIIAGAGLAATVPPGMQAGNDWTFGNISYDYKNNVEPSLSSRHQERIGFVDQFFFRPEIVAFIPFNSFELHIETLSGSAADVLKQILGSSATIDDEVSSKPRPEWNYVFKQEDYMAGVQQIRRHIEEGDCYELNFCIEAFATEQKIDPVYVFYKLNHLNPAPFAALYRHSDAWLLCASPERFLHKQGDLVLSQPIKGTSRRGKDPVQDEQLKTALLNDPKERAENVMIVDLVRNDLARSCVPGTVTVPELFGVYTFPQVHQLISTVTGNVKPETSVAQMIENAFPMGSMTGAPKVRVMQLIEQYERSRRGLYSGSVGYITPQGNFDFNVVIRSLLYNNDTGYLSYQTGGAITYDSDPLQEWKETRLKAQAMEQVFL